MKCPHCNRTGNAFQRIFMRQKGTKSRYCIFCGGEVVLKYNWGKIVLLSVGVLAGLILLNIILQIFGWPGINGGFAGGLGGAIIAIYMRKKPFLNIEAIAKEKKKRRK
ncbi:MAG: hypothetical protein PHE56_05255 [Bacteroidales bacterium]|nr:hypothetical protein [Bacteroidales bacterium]